MKLTIEIDDERMVRIREFKRIFDSIMGEMFEKKPKMVLEGGKND